jgi:hypothetical protein
MKIIVRKSVLLVSLFLFATYLQAQSLKGRIVDQKTGEPLAGAVVKIENEKTDKKWVIAVSLDGIFNFKNVPAGTYEIEVKHIGYTKSKEKIILNNGVTIRDITLFEETTALSEVKVSASAKETDKAARGIEKNAETVKNVLSQRAIEISPDVTVANALQRMSGVTVERSSSGEGRYAIIRGMDQRYNSTLVNGVKIPSPDDRFRYVPMDLFPSDLLERLEVIKSLTPSMEADAIGGTMNMVMKSAPAKRIINGFFALGVNTLFNDRPFLTFNQNAANKLDPSERNGSGYVATDADFSRLNARLRPLTNTANTQFGFTAGDRFLKKKLGVLLGLSFQNMYRGSDQVFNQQYAQPTYLPNVNGTLVDNYPLFSDSYIRQYSTQQRRIGVNNKIDYIINDRNKISLYNLYVHMDDFQARYSIDSNVLTNRGNVSELYRSRWQIQSIYNSTLQGDHQLNKLWAVNWSAVYSIAKQLVPDESEYQVDNSINVQPTVYVLKSMTRRWWHNEDQDLSGYLNFNYSPTVFNRKATFSIGGLYRHKERNKYYNRYNLSTVGSTQLYTNIYDAKYQFNPAGAGIGEPGSGNNYGITENISAGYVQFKINPIAQLQVLGGVRVERTDQIYTTALPKTIDGRSGNIYYTDILPSLHIKYQLTDKQNIRTSYFRSLVRPGFFEITPNPIQLEDYTEQGNPYLKHTTADNYDLRYELFPNGADQILIGAFYKDIYNPIETGFIRTLSTGGNSSPGSLYLTPLNFGQARNYGIEAVVTKYFGKIGINANYTFTQSEITTDRNYFFYNSNTGRTDTKIVTETRPMQGQAKHIGNLSLLFKDPKLGLDIQLAYVYTGERIVQVSLYSGLDSWQLPYSQLDFSFEKKLGKKIAFYAKVNNLTNSMREVVIKQPYLLANTLNRIAGQTDQNRIFVQSDTYRVSFLAGIRFKL